MYLEDTLTMFMELSWEVGGDLHYEKGGDACRKFWIKPLKETNLGVAKAFLTLL